MHCEVRRLMGNHEREDLSEDLRRPPSLPSGLDQVDDLSNSPSALKPSSSIPLRLSQLGMASSQSSGPRKPTTTPAVYHQRIPAASGTRPSYKPPLKLVKRPATKQPSQEDRAGHAGREVQPGRQSMETLGLIPLAQDMATVQRVSLQQGRPLAPRSNARGDAFLFVYCRCLTDLVCYLSGSIYNYSVNSLTQGCLGSCLMIQSVIQAAHKRDNAEKVNIFGAALQFLYGGLTNMVC